MSLPTVLLPELPALLVIADECHFGRAAERLNVSQSRVSQIVRRIEDVVGYRIFHRRPTVRLTGAGEMLANAARQAMDDLDSGLALAEDTAKGRLGIVRLGYAPVAMMTKLPRLLNAFHKRNPLVRLHLHTTYSMNLWSGFDAGQYDLIIGREKQVRRGFTSHLFVRDGLVAAVPEGDFDPSQEGLSIARLADRDFVASDDSIAPQWHRTIASIAHSEGFEPRITQRTNDWGATLALVASGLGVSIVSSTLAQIRFPGVAFIPLKGAHDVCSFWLARRDRPESAAVELLFSELSANSTVDE